MRKRFTTMLLAAAGLFALPAAAQQSGDPSSQERVTASGVFLNSEGAEAGRATLTQTPAGVLVEAEVSGLPEGEHGFHLHETGQCDAEGGFQSAGGHFKAGDAEAHGYHAEDGPHAGDMPNQFVGGDGVLRAHVMNPRVSLEEGGEGYLLAGDGAALVVHAGADDYHSQPSGEAGDRLACAVIEAD